MLFDKLRQIEERYRELNRSLSDPVVLGHTRRSRGRRVIDGERPLGDPATLSEEDVLAFVLKALEPFVDR